MTAITINSNNDTHCYARNKHCQQPTATTDTIMATTNNKQTTKHKHKQTNKQQTNNKQTTKHKHKQQTTTNNKHKQHTTYNNNNNNNNNTNKQ